MFATLRRSARGLLASSSSIMPESSAAFSQCLVMTDTSTAVNVSRSYSAAADAGKPQTKVCVVGSGPSGFYVTEKVRTSVYLSFNFRPFYPQHRQFSPFSGSLLTKTIQLLKQYGDSVHVSMIERLPTPFGLVRCARKVSFYSKQNSTKLSPPLPLSPTRFQTQL